MVGDGGLVDLGDAAFLGADHAAEVTEVIDGERDVGGQGFAHRLAVVPGLGDGEQLEVLLHAIGDLVEHHRALRVRGLAPGVLGGVGRVEGAVHVLRVRAGHLAERPAGDRRDVLEVLALDGLAPLASDEILVALLELDLASRLTRIRVSHRSPLRDLKTRQLPSAMSAPMSVDAPGHPVKMAISRAFRRMSREGGNPFTCRATCNRPETHQARRAIPKRARRR